jgi:hypothetical protein
MSADPETRETTATSVDRAAHAYCPVCNPSPEPGDLITALCGARYPFWGRRDRPVNICKVCDALTTTAVFECGHRGA